MNVALFMNGFLSISLSVVRHSICSLVSILNPQMIVIGGTLAIVNDHLLAGIRELVYKRSLPLATRELELVISPPDPDAGVMGAAILVVEEQMKAKNVETVILRHSAHPALK